jgi:hypothetical protein
MSDYRVNFLFTVSFKVAVSSPGGKASKNCGLAAREENFYK